MVKDWNHKELQIQCSKAIASMALNYNNKKALIKQGVIPLLKRALEMECDVEIAAREALKILGDQ